jgi:hypothetical protein
MDDSEISVLTTVGKEKETVGDAEVNNENNMLDDNCDALSWDSDNIPRQIDFPAEVSSGIKKRKESLRFDKAPDRVSLGKISTFPLFGSI